MVPLRYHALRVPPRAPALSRVQRRGILSDFERETGANRWQKANERLSVMVGA
jgi:hypothetical protein